jgi:hypothetical protein
MLLAFAGNWDATAVGTLALAVVTGVSLVFGWKSLPPEPPCSISSAPARSGH